MKYTPEEILMEWLDYLPQDYLGDWGLKLYVENNEGKQQGVAEWGPWSGPLSGTKKKLVASDVVVYATDVCAQAQPRVSGFCELQWHRNGAKKGCPFKVGGTLQPAYDTGNAITTSECPDCKGSKKYVGIHEITSCYTCQGHPA